MDTNDSMEISELIKLLALRESRLKRLIRLETPPQIIEEEKVKVEEFRQRVAQRPAYIKQQLPLKVAKAKQYIDILAQREEMIEQSLLGELSLAFIDLELILAGDAPRSKIIEIPFEREDLNSLWQTFCTNMKEHNLKAVRSLSQLLDIAIADLELLNLPQLPEAE